MSKIFCKIKKTVIKDKLWEYTSSCFGVVDTKKILTCRIFG